MSSAVIIRGYQIERNWGRVGGPLRSPVFIFLVAIVTLVLAQTTSGVSFFFLPIIVGFLRNRPMSGIVLWNVILGAFIIGWVVAICKALGSR